VWSGGRRGEDATLAACYRNSLGLAVANGVRTIAFPAISTGIYRFPLERAAAIAVRETRAFLAREQALERVVFVCFSEPALAGYRRALGR
jgi:O-acetyl-ADP-ribose deacetylase (regulator of RNase III)